MTIATFNLSDEAIKNLNVLKIKLNKKKSPIVDELIKNKYQESENEIKN